MRKQDRCLNTDRNNRYKELILLNSKIYIYIYKIIQLKKMGKGPEKTFSQRRHTDGQQAHEEVLNITNYQTNANQNHNEMSPHTCQDDFHQKDKQ